MHSTEAEVSDTMVANLASFVCAAYSPKAIYIYTISELRWYLFCKHMAKSDKLPFTLGALRQHVLRVHIQTAQARVCGQVSIVPQEPPSVEFPAKWLPQGVRWPAETNHDRYPPAPKAIIQLVSCHCKSDCSSARFSCRTNNISCTDLCRCGSECQNDEDTQNKH